MVGLTVASGVATAKVWANGDNVAAQTTSDTDHANGNPKEKKGPIGNKAEERDPKAGKDVVPCDANQLIAAILLANRNGRATLELAENCSYVLTANQDGSGLPVITERLTLLGHNTTIERAANASDFRIFTVGAGGDLELTGLTVKGGRTTTAAGGGGALVQAGGGLKVFGSKFIYNQSGLDGGGAIANRGVTEIKQSTFADNATPSTGGAIANDGGQLSIEDSQLKHNSARVGGAVYSGGVVTLTKVDLEGNTATDAGGGLYADGSATVLKSSISGNNASLGGGLVVTLHTSAVVRDTEIVGNTGVADGGGVHNDGNLVIEDSKINRNRVERFGGGIFVGGLLFGERGILTLRNSEVNGNSAYGEQGQAGGIYNFLGRVTLADTEVARNAATKTPGGVYSTNVNVTLTGDSAIIANRPTNCAGGTRAVIVGCFG